MTTGAGTMAFGTGPYGLANVDAPSTLAGQLTSSRYLQADGTAKQTSDGTGAFVGMNDSFQRAVILIAYGVDMPDFIDAAFPSRVRADVTRALAPLTEGQSPALELVDVVAIDNGGSFTATQVKVRDLINGGGVRVLEPFRRGT